MKFSRWLLVLTLSLLSTVSWGCSLQNTSLPEAVKKELELKCLQAEASAKVNLENVTVEKVSSYAGIATEVAKAIGVAAKELNVGVNEFIVTLAGILTVAVILGKTFGKLLMLILIATMVNIFIYHILKIIWLEETGDVLEVSTFFGWKKHKHPVKKLMSYRSASEGQIFITLALLVVAFGSIALVGINGL